MYSKVRKQQIEPDDVVTRDDAPLSFVELSLVKALVNALRREFAVEVATTDHRVRGGSDG